MPTSSFPPVITSAEPKVIDPMHIAGTRRRLLGFEKYDTDKLSNDHPAEIGLEGVLDHSNQLNGKENVLMPLSAVPNEGSDHLVQNDDGLLGKAIRVQHSLKSTLTSMVKRIATALYQAGRQISQKVSTRSYADGQTQDNSTSAGPNGTNFNLTRNFSNATNLSATAAYTSLATSVLYTETFAAFMSSAVPAYTTSQQAGSPSTTSSLQSTEDQSTSLTAIPYGTSSSYNLISFSSTPYSTGARTGSSVVNTTANMTFSYTSAMPSSLSVTEAPTSYSNQYPGGVSSAGGAITAAETTSSSLSSSPRGAPASPTNATSPLTNSSLLNRTTETTAPFLPQTSTIPSLSSAVLSSMPGSMFPLSSWMPSSASLHLSATPQGLVATSPPAPRASTTRGGTVVPLSRFNRTGPGQIPAILDLRSMGTIRLAVRCGGAAVGLDAAAQDPRLVTTRPVGNPLIDAFKVRSRGRSAQAARG